MTRAIPPFDLLSAYRAELDREPVRESISADDGEWLTIGTLFARAPGLPKTQGAAVRRLARTQLRALLGDARWVMGSPIDPSPPASDTEMAPRVRILCEDIEDANAIGFADTFVRTYLASGDAISELERGRFDALRARFAWKRGDHATADELYGHVAARGKRIKAPELAARAAIGGFVLARIRGNYPEAKSAAEQALALADAHGYTRIAALAHHALMVAAATSGDHNEALHHGWRAYEAVKGDAIAEGGQLADLGRLFLESGHPEHAVDAFSAALACPLPKRVLLPALGAAALAAAQRGDRHLVASYAKRVRMEADGTALPYATATSLLDIASALAMVNEHAAAGDARQASLDLARAHRYHEIEYRAEQLDTAAPPMRSPVVALSDESAGIGTSIGQLAGSAS